MRRGHGEGRALHAAGVLSDGEARAIQAALADILAPVRANPAFVDGEDEDVHSFVERLLVERLGDAGARALISNAPTKDPKIRGNVAVVHDVHGAQVSFNGHLLYTYAGDKAPGTAMGYGKAGKWFVATPSLAQW